MGVYINGVDLEKYMDLLSDLLVEKGLVEEEEVSDLKKACLNKFE